MILCRNCDKEKEQKAFPKGRSICYPCKYKIAGGSKHDPAYSQKYTRDNAHILRYKAYVHRDRHHYKCESTPKNIALYLMSMPCYYCKVEKAGGLDRIDNLVGHTEINVRPCCEKCNNILGDIPDAAKQLLIRGLEQINLEGLLKEWTIIPTKRNKKKSTPLSLP